MTRRCVLLALVGLGLVRARCPDVACESGTNCDYGTGLCRRFRVPADGLQDFAPDWNKCVDVVCPSGYHCDGTSGVCARLAREPPHHCEGIVCPPGFTCSDSRCVKDDPIATEDLDPNPLCRSVKCPDGFSCSDTDGMCHPYRLHYHPGVRFGSEQFEQLQDESLTLLECPANSHYDDCAAPCTATCTDIRPDCKQHDYDCIRGCVCDDGFVQASTLNTTCVPAERCQDVVKADNITCQGLRCGRGMRCMDGFCNPIHCPPALKPTMTARCQKLVIVRDRRNCVSLLNECSLRNQ